MKTIIAVQCRLSSTRLPGKALLKLGGKTVLDWNLASMKKVQADEYYVATDEASFESLAPIAERNGYKIFKGPLEDVLERYCLLIKESGADLVVRATADNPFLFYESAQALLEEFHKLSKNQKIDYITYTNLPHGSGVEIFQACSILDAAGKTNDPYDHEHVGPALYNHPETYRCKMIPSPEKWSHPELRTTIDTPFDYRRAVAIVDKLSSGDFSEEKPVAEPYTAEQIISAFDDPGISFPVLCVPCVKKGRGTGHLRRCLSVAISTGGDVYIPEDAGLEEKDELLKEAKENGLKDWQVVSEIPGAGTYSLVLTDAFTIERDFAMKLAKIAPVAAIDEGSLNADLCDCLVDIIPSYGLARPANISDPSFVTLPKNKRSLPPLADPSDVKNILVTAGGEDPSDLVVPTSIAFASLGKKITAIVQNPDEALKRVDEKLRPCIEFIRPVHNLREQLSKYDVVVTHYGFTAFEAVAAGCGVVLLGTTPLHVQLAEKYGFIYMLTGELTSEKAAAALKDVKLLYPDSPFTKEGAGRKNLGDFVKFLSHGRRFSCPVCQGHHDSFLDPIVSRTTLHTFRRCHNCGMLYMAWTVDEGDTKYNASYFFEDYKKQYGKTYLDDFKHIKSQCVRRTSVIDYLYRGAHKAVTPAVLDIGCAFGPYLDAANDAGWQVFGTDVSQEAVNYVQETLHFPASCGKFPEFNSEEEFGIKKFDAVTMWYVIEHFQNLDSVLKKVSQILKTGGIFAFSTPSASGVSGRFNTQLFFQNSPADHYTLWEPGRASSILKKYGFKVVKIVSTGHHPERFPNMKKNVKPTSLKFALYSGASHFFGLGDTFEVYCRKERD